MRKSFQRVLLLCAEKYSLFHSFMELLDEMAQETKGFDIRHRLKATDLRINSQMFRFPFRVRDSWEKHLLGKANEILLGEIRDYRPDLVLVYNSEFLLPETCKEIKKNARLIFFMGDSPFYTPLNNYYLACLSHADLILSPDSFWNQQLNTMGLNRTLFFVPGIDPRSYFPLREPRELAGIEERDVLYVGTSYVNSWGYKKALLMSQFTKFNFRLYGNSMWRRWFRFFPELEEKFIESDFIPTAVLNKMFNQAKLIPVDGNPGILNGYHLRFFEALGAGGLPLVEYRKDVAGLVLKGCRATLPLIKNYRQAGELANYFLKNESERKELVRELKKFILSRYNAKSNSEMILAALKINF